MMITITTTIIASFFFFFFQTHYSVHSIGKDFLFKALRSEVTGGIYLIGLFHSIFGPFFVILVLVH